MCLWRRCGTATRSIKNKVKPAGALPFTLLGADNSAKLDTLMAGARPPGTTSAKIFDLLRLGHSRETILQGLSLLEQISWSTTPTEQAHLPASKVLQSHRALSQAVMRARSMVVSMHPLLAISNEEKKRQCLLDKLARLEWRQPQQISGRRFYVKEAMSQARSMLLQERAKGVRVQNHVMAQHGAKWSTFRATTKKKHEAHAQHLAAERTEKLEGEKEAVRVELRSLRAAAQTDAGRDCSWRMTHCKLPTKELGYLQSLWDDRTMTERVVGDRRRVALQDIEPSSEAFQKALQTFEVEAEAAKVQTLPWLKDLVNHRDCFQHSLRNFRAGGSERLLKFVYGVQSPRLGFFVEAKETEAMRGVCEAMAYQDQMLNEWEYEYEWVPGSFCCSDDGSFLPDAEVWVKSDVVYLGGVRLATGSDWKPLCDVLRLLPPMTRGGKEAKEKAPSKRVDPNT